MLGFALGLAALAAVAAQVPADPERAAEPRSGRGFIATPVHSADEDRKLLALFEGLRVADATDGMDAAGLHNVGLMDPQIRPLWKDSKAYRHRFVGIAVTARYVPTQRPAAVARYGRKIMEDDKSGRRELYRKAGLPPDASTRQ